MTTTPGSAPPGERGHAAAPGAPMGAADWDARYAATDLIWGAGANRWVAQYTANLPPGRAVDLACGEGRNALYLAEHGWSVTAVDFSPVALDKARRLAESRPPAAGGAVRWVCADVAEYRSEPVDLAMLVYLHLPAATRRAVLRRAVDAVEPGGHLLVVGHNSRNVAEGTGGPQDPGILYTAADLVAEMAAIDAGMVVDDASEPVREVPGADRPAIDTVLRAHRTG